MLVFEISFCSKLFTVECCKIFLLFSTTIKRAFPFPLKSVLHSHDTPDSNRSINEQLFHVVASMDGHPSSYSSLVRLQYVRLIDGEQQRRSESIEELDTMAVELLLRFYRITRFKPSRIFYFRSGIPESVSHHVGYPSFHGMTTPEICLLDVDLRNVLWRRCNCAPPIQRWRICI